MQTLARAFADYDLDLIQIIASLWDGELAAKDRKVAAEELAALMIRPEAALATWERLTQDEKSAAGDLLNHDGRIPYFHFIRRYGEIRPMGPARRERERPWLAPENVTEGLFYRGLIVRAFEQTPAGAQEYILIPAELREMLPEPEAPLVTSPGYPVAPPRKLLSPHPIAPDDIATLIAYLRVREANARQWLVNTSVETVDRHLRRPTEPAYRAFLTQLLYDLNLIADEEVLTQVATRVNTDSAPPWLEAPRVFQVRSLAETWLTSPNWNELAFTHGLEADGWPNDPRLARQAVLSALQNVPVEIWWSIDSLIEHIKQSNPDFQRPGGDYGGWFLRDAYSGEIMHGFQYWDSIEGAVIRFILSGPMHWLGLVRVGRGAFVLTEAGLALMGRGEWPSTPDPQTHIRVDDQAVISVPAELSRFDRIRIARFSAWISPPPLKMGHDRDDGSYLYSLTPQSIQRIEDEDITIGQHIIPFLQRLSGQNLPANVLKMLEAWSESPNEVIIEDTVILRARDLKVYERLRKTDRISKFLGDPAGPQAHTIKREDLPALLSALRLMGILPLFEGYERDNWP